MKAHIIFICTGLFLLVFSCTEDPIKKENKKAIKVKVDNSISTDFSVNEFESNIEKQLLEEIKICNPKELDDSDPAKCACSPKYFRFFKLSKHLPMEDAFILLVKSEYNKFPIRRTLIFEREKGVLINVNGFNANLIEKRASTSGYDDLILRFPDRVDDQMSRLTYYNCIFSWKEGKYQMKKVEEIDEDYPRKIKAEFQDSMNMVINGILIQNKMIF